MTCRVCREKRHNEQKCETGGDKHRDGMRSDRKRPRDRACEEKTFIVRAIEAQSAVDRRGDCKNRYRVYFGKDGERLVILLGGGSKRRQQTDIYAAHALWAEYKKRKREE